MLLNAYLFIKNEFVCRKLLDICFDGILLVKAEEHYQTKTIIAQ